MKKVFIYCQTEIEEGDRCIEQCDHCQLYYKPMEDYHKKEENNNEVI